MRPWCLVLVAALAAPVRAEPLGDATPTLRIEHPGAQVMIERATLALRVEDRAVAGTLALALSATYSARDTALVLEVPAGTRITGLAIASQRFEARPERHVARVVAAQTARGDYDAIVNGRQDPALLQWLGSRAGRDRLELRVYPLGSGTTVTAVIALALPRITELAIDPDDQLIRRLDVDVHGTPRETWTDVHDRRTLALPRTAVPVEVTRPPGSLVGETSSLFAGVVPPRITVVIGQPVSSNCSFGGNRVIRRVVRDHHPQLRYCYERVAQANPWLAGTAELAFQIEDDGHVSAAHVGGELDHPEVAACIEREARSWQFAAGDGRAQVHYPLHFRLAGNEPRQAE